MKKTFPAEALDQRLDRLESQIFGLPAQAMSYVDRIERLKKTAGIGVDVAGSAYTAIGPGASQNRSGNLSGSAQMRRGPMPRDFGGISRGDNPFSASPSPFFNDDSDSLTDRLLPEHGQSGQMEGFGAFTPLPRGSVHSFSFSTPGFDFGSESNEILERMQKPMMELLRRFGFSPDFSNGSAPVLPESNGGLNVAPQDSLRNLKKQLTPREELPPYSDPNSI